MMRTLIIALVLAGAASTARAERNPPSWTFELRLSPYRPELGDQGSVERRLFNRTFARGLEDAWIERKPMLKAVELEYLVPTQAGLVGVVGRLGYWNVAGRARVCTDAAGAVIACGSAEDALDPDSSSAGNTPVSFTLMPIGATFVYRMDLLRRWNIPFVPYAKAGIEYVLFWARTNGDVSRRREADGSKTRGEGGALHGVGALGLAVDIDWIDPSTRGYSSAGLLHSAVFAEWQRSQKLDAGVGADLDLTGDRWTFGLALDFE